MSAIEAIRSRRSIRGLTGPPLSAGEIEELVGLALLAPAPHHTTPWRFAQVLDGPARERLSDAMSAAWQRDMASDGVPAAQQTRALQRSRRRIDDAPTLDQIRSESINLDSQERNLDVFPYLILKTRHVHNRHFDHRGIERDICPYYIAELPMEGTCDELYYLEEEQEKHTHLESRDANHDVIPGTDFYGMNALLDIEH